MKKFTKELGPGWITLVENDDYALCRLIFGDGLEVDADEEETPLLKKGFQQIQEYWTGHRVIFTLPLAPGGSDFEREVWDPHSLWGTLYHPDAAGGAGAGGYRGEPRAGHQGGGRLPHSDLYPDAPGGRPRDGA